MRNKGLSTMFMVAFISAILLLVSLPQNTEAKETLSEWSNSAGVRENTTAYATSALGPSLEFYMNNGFVDTPKTALGTGEGKFQFDADILMGSAINNLTISWRVQSGGLGGPFGVRINGNNTVIIGEMSISGEFIFPDYKTFNVTDPNFKLNTWRHIRITKEANNATYIIIVGADTFIYNSIYPSFVLFDKIVVCGPHVMSGSSVFVDNIDIQYTPSTLEVAAGWYDTILGSEYFPVAMVLIFGMLALAVVKGVLAS